MIVSLLKAYYGPAATPENDFRFKWLPHLDGDMSQLPFFETMTRGEVEGYFVFGQNPAAGAPNAGLHRAGLRQLKWLVVADWFETETAVFWKNDPKGPAAERDQDRSLFHARRQHRRQGRQLHEYATAHPVARQSGGSPKAIAGPTSGSSGTWAGG